MKRINFYYIQQVKEKGGLYDIPTKRISSPDVAYEVIEKILSLSSAAAEHFVVVPLNTKNEILGIHVLFKGTLNASIVNPREVFQAALLNNAASIICFHNHPSGDVRPSREDIEVTKRLSEAGRILGIELLDHIIIGDGYYSLKERGDMF